MKDLTESFDDFLTDFKKIVKRCEHGTLTNSMIGDRIVIGINDKQL